MENVMRVEKPALEVEQVSFSFKKGKSVLHNVNFSLPQGAVMTLLGPNGSGKTTMLNCLLNNYDRYSGEIRLFGQNIKDYKAKEYAALVAYVPQLTTLNFEYSVEEFVLMGINPRKSFFEQPNQQDYEIAYRSMEQMGIRHLAKQLMNEISGGERQMAYIARALTQEPKMIIMDEPTSALDYANQYKVIQILKELNQRGFTIILTSHNPEYALMLSGYVGMISKHKPFSFGSIDDLINDDSLSELYQAEIKVRYLPEYDTSVCVRVNKREE